MNIKPTNLTTLQHLHRQRPSIEPQNLKANTLKSARRTRHTPPLPPVIQPDAGKRIEASRLALQTAATAKATVIASTGVEASPTPDPVPPTPQPQPQAYNIDDLIASWGKSDSVYDFDGSGSVGVADLLHFINHYLKFTQPDGSGQTNAPGEVAVVDDSTKPAPETTADSELPQVAAADEPAETVETPETPTDEQPPVISTADVLTRLGLTSDSPKSKLAGLNGAAARAALGIGEAPGKSAGHSMGGLRSLTDALYTHLSSAGFANQPPTNIRELIASLNLSTKQSDFMLKSMSEKYPDGLGVDVVA